MDTDVPTPGWRLSPILGIALFVMIAAVVVGVVFKALLVLVVLAVVGVLLLMVALRARVPRART